MLKQNSTIANLILSILLTYPIWANAQDQNNTLNAELTELKIQNKVLRENLKIIKESTEELHSIYMWALGFSATFLITFLGVNVYFLNTKSKDELEKISAKIKIIEEETKNANEEHINSRFSIIEKEISEQIDQATKEISNQRNSISKEIAQKIEGLKEPINAINLDLKETKIEMLEKNGNKGILITRYIKLIEFILNTYGGDKFDWKIPKILTKIIEFQKSGVRFETYEVSDVYKVLSSLPSQYSDYVTQIKSRIVE